jgi:hypothetical protein
LRQVSIRHQHRAPKLLQYGCDFGIGKRSFESGRAFLNLGLNVGGKFRGNVLLLRSGQPEFHCV